MGSLREFATVASLAFLAMAAAMTAQALHIPLPFLHAPKLIAFVAAPALHIPAPTPVFPVPTARPMPPPSAEMAAGAPDESSDEGEGHAMPRDAQAAPALPPQSIAIDPALAGKMAADVAGRMHDVVPADLAPYFDVYLYVSKAAAGPWAQHMFVFHKSGDGTLEFERAIPVSTGRELHEKYFTDTPSGIFELDPDRFDRTHYSHTWNDAAMPWAMFLNYTHDGRLTGVALHSAEGHAFDLGRRASGGCVRLPPADAELLFNRFEAEERGRVPVIAFDRLRQTTDTGGAIMRDASGNPLLAPGYKVLLIIEDNSGGPPLVAAVS
jgi:lipoprotein-anchoring transpeptidase ErfK/SrfK